MYITLPSLLYTCLQYTSITSSIHHSMLRTYRFFYTLLNITPPSLLYTCLQYTSITSSIHHSMLRTYRFFYTLLNITLPSLTLHISLNCTPSSCSVCHCTLHCITLHFLRLSVSHSKYFCGKNIRSLSFDSGKANNPVKKYISNLSILLTVHLNIFIY